MSIDLSTAGAIARYIKVARKTTPVKAYVQGRISLIPKEAGEVKVFHPDQDPLLIGEADQVERVIEANRDQITTVHLENDRRNSAIPLLDLRRIEARIEPGAIIRDLTTIGKDCIIMMGAVINIGAVIGARTMIDMNAVVGARAQVGENCHIGAGAVLAGVLEPPSAQPVRIEDGVLVGANAVVLEGVRIGKGTVVAAGAVVTRDVEPGTVVAGIPARPVKTVDEQTESKSKLLDDLRG